MEQNSPAVGAPVEPTVRPVAWLHTVRVVSPHANPNEIDHALSFSPSSFPLGATGMFESTGVVPLYDEQTLWNACARAGDIERAKLADDTADALRFRWLCRYPDWHFIEHLCRYPDWHFIEHLCRQTTASTSAECLADLRRVIDARRSVELGPLEQHVPPKA